MTKTRGMTLGKFAPLHRGHQYVIETALAEVDELVVLIYDSPQVTTVPLYARANWIRNLYPEVDVIEAWGGPTEVGATPEIMKLNEDYIVERLQGREITHFYCSEFYGEHVSQRLGAVERQVDAARGAVPISGTAVRENPYAARPFLHPEVYRDLVANVVFLGAPSTGKTTLVTRLAEELNTVWMPEYGREYWHDHQVDRRLSPEQLVEIAEGHLQREEAMLWEANRYLLTDTNAITTYMFALNYHGYAHPRLTSMAEKAQSRYDLVFVCDTDIPYDDTWDRSGEVNRSIFQKQIFGRPRDAQNSLHHAARRSRYESCQRKRSAESIS